MIGNKSAGQKILITGATGFIGSNIAKGLIKLGYDVFATFRTASSFDKCLEIKKNINWINTDTPDWKENIRSIKPDQLIHVAWKGIDFENRNDWEIQLSNFQMSRQFFDLAKEIEVKKVISFGSQAEYGLYNYPVNELTSTIPVDAYGTIKLLTSNYLRNLFVNTETEWYWIRVFSVFGEGDNPLWIIPSVISKLLQKEPVQLTSCEQKYNYLYINDFVNQLLSVVECYENKSGIYNLCNAESISLKELLIYIAKLMNVSTDLLQFGALPMRLTQNILITGDNRKFVDSFRRTGNEFFGLRDGLKRTINYQKKIS